MHNKLFLRLSLLMLVLLLVGASLTVGGRDRGQFMFVDELKPGMTGFCKTVIKNNQMTTFQFKIVDIMATQYVGGINPAYHNVILARAGQGIEQAGGIAAGMSGSPCYIDNKLIGALFAAPAWETTLNDPNPSFLIQPIEDMLPVLDACEQKAGTPVGAAGLMSYLPGPDRTIAASSLTGATTIRKIRVMSTPPSPEEMRDHPETLYVQMLTTPITVTGLSNRAFNWLKSGVNAKALDLQGSALRYLRGESRFHDFVRVLSRGLEDRYDVRVYNMGLNGQVGQGAQGLANPADLEPGSPVGTAMMIGDISYGGYGTVTYRENQCLIAYGHPDLLLGDTDLFMTSAYIADTVKSIYWPWKQGYLGQEIGSILEDRLTGIGGAIGRMANAVQLDLKVTDKDTGMSREFKSKSVALPDWHWYNLMIAGVEAIDRTLNRVGQGTLVMDMTINGAGMPQPLRRHEVFVSNSDISGEAMVDPAWIDYMLAWNEFADPQISSIELNMHVERQLKVKVIEGVEPDQQSVKAGSKIRYTVTLQAYHGKQETVSGYITIPQYASGDYIALEAFPARSFFWKYEMYGPWVRPWWTDKITSLNDLIQAIEDVPTNGLLIVTAYSLTKGGRYAVYAYDLKPLGDWYVDGDRTSEGYAQVK